MPAIELALDWIAVAYDARYYVAEVAAVVVSNASTKRYSHLATDSLREAIGKIGKKAA